VACPFFLPMEKLENGSWPHPSRLPLGCGWSGHCSAPGHDGEAPSQEELQQFCNLGYADGCTRLPREREWDSVRFDARTIVDAAKNNQRVQIRYICERAHLPAENGLLEFALAQASWIKRHPDARVQRMAECFLASYLARQNQGMMQSVAS
jgi:hypothetical protein